MDKVKNCNHTVKKTAYALKTPHVVFLSFIFPSVFGRYIDKALISQWNSPIDIVWLRNLDLWPMTLTYKLDLDILPLDLHAKIQVCTSVRSVVRVVTDRQTHTHTQTYDVKTITPDMSETWGVTIPDWTIQTKGTRIIFYCWRIPTWVSLACRKEKHKN